jgi:uncharacterized BrkB/YihY/UPF0761 family membrane protein
MEILYTYCSCLSEILHLTNEVLPNFIIHTLLVLVFSVYLAPCLSNSLIYSTVGSLMKIMTLCLFVYYLFIFCIRFFLFYSYHPDDHFKYYTLALCHFSNELTLLRFIMISITKHQTHRFTFTRLLLSLKYY